jgi:hypothetical protein
MIAHVDQPPEAEPHNGNVLCTFISGDEKIQILVTRHAFILFQRRGRSAVDELMEEAAGFVPTPFTVAKRKRSRETPA